MSAQSLAVAYYFSYVLAAPISALIIGADLNQAYCSIISPSSRWGTHAVAVFCLMFIATVVQEIYSAIERDSDPLEKLLQQPRPSNILTPISIGCVEFVVQVYFVKLLYTKLGKWTLAIFSLLICCLNFLLSWACAINILLKLKDPSKEQVNPADLSLPNFNIGNQIFTAWLASSTFTGLVIFASQLYSSRQARVTGQGLIIRFFRNDKTSTKIGVIGLQTCAFSVVLIMAISLLFLINEFTEDKPVPAQSGCFVFLNLMRVPVSCATFGFTMERQEKLDANRISMPFTSSIIGDSMDDLSLHESKKNVLKNQVTVHTVRSQVYES